MQEYDDDWVAVAAERGRCSRLLNLVKQLVIPVFDQLGSRQLVCTAVTGMHTAM